MLEMSQIGEIRRMYAVEGWGIKTIARRLGVSRNTVRRVLREELKCVAAPAAQKSVAA